MQTIKKVLQGIINNGISQYFTEKSSFFYFFQYACIREDHNANIIVCLIIRDLCNGKLACFSSK